MEAADNALTPRAWEDGFGIGWDQAHETVGGGPTPDAMPQSQHLTDAEFNDLLVELCNPDTYDISWDGTYDFPDLDGIGNQYRPQIEPSLTTELTSPSSSGGVTQTPSSGDFDFISSPGSYQTPHMSPNSLMESPQAYFAGRDKLAPDQLNISPFNKEGFASGAPSMAPSANFDLNSPAGLYQGPNMSPNSLTGSPQVYLARPSQFTPDQINNSPYTRASVAPEAPSMASPLLSQTNRASRKRPQRVKNSPPGMKESGESARSWRKANKPEPCPACPRHFPFQSDLNKHLIAIHPKVAVEHGFSTDRHVCEWCRRTYARSDGLKRHLTNQHQREKTWRRRSQN